MRLWSLTYLATLSLAAFAAVPGSASAQEIALRVNGELITSRDIVQRALFQNLPSLQNPISDFYERLSALLASDKAKETFRQKASAAQPRTPNPLFSPAWRWTSGVLCRMVESDQGAFMGVAIAAGNQAPAVSQCILFGGAGWICCFRRPSIVASARWRTRLSADKPRRWRF
jgi:hypothetical protein